MGFSELNEPTSVLVANARKAKCCKVAYDPSCVQHQVRVTQVHSKGLVFGLLEVEQREMVW